MKEVTIKAHTRKSKKGKTVTVHSYSRRVGHKGTISPKRSKEDMGKEYKKRLDEATSEKKSTEKPIDNGIWDEKEEAAYRRYLEEIQTGKSTVNNIKRLKITEAREAAERAAKKAAKDAERAKNSANKVQNTASSTKRRNDFMSKIEDKIASFISKHSKATYKRYL